MQGKDRVIVAIVIAVCTTIMFVSAIVAEVYIKTNHSECKCPQMDENACGITEDDVHKMDSIMGITETDFSK